MTCKDCAEPHGIIEKVVYWYERLSLRKQMQGRDRARHRRVIQHSEQRRLSKKKRKELTSRRYKLDAEKHK